MVTTKKKELRVLILEDVAADAELLERELRKAKMKFVSKLVDTKNSFTKALKDFKPDIILSDYMMPQFTGMDALEIVKEKYPTIPVIIVTGSMNEETAVECMKKGATDYVIKEHILRIGSAINTALEKKRIIDEKNRVEKALINAGYEWKTTFDAINDAVCLLDFDGKILRGNVALRNMLGKPFQEIIGYRNREFFNNLVKPNEVCPFERMKETRIRESWDVQLNNRWFTISVDPLMDDDNNIIGGVQIISDITEKKQAEEDMKASQEYVRNIIDSSLNMIITVDKNRRIVEFNQAAQKAFGYSKEEVFGKNIGILYANPADGSKLYKTLKRSSLFSGEILNKRKNGELFPSFLSSSILQGKKGEFVGIMGISRDITERKQSEKRIKQLNSLISAVRNVNQLIAREKDRDRLLKGACESFSEISGLNYAWIALINESGKLVSRAEAGLGRKFLPLVKLLKRGELPVCAQRALAESEVVIIKDDSTCNDCPLVGSKVDSGVMSIRLEHQGKVYGMLVVSLPVDAVSDEDEQNLLYEVAGDIAFGLYSMELEEELAKSEEKYQYLYENAPVMLHSINQNGKIVSVSNSWLEKFGYTRDEVIGRKSIEFLTEESRQYKINEDFPKFVKEGYVKSE